MIVHKLFDGEDQSHGGGAIVVCSAYGSGAVGLEEVLVELLGSGPGPGNKLTGEI